MDILTDKKQPIFGKESRFREIFRPQKFYGPDMEIGALRKYGPGALAAAGILGATGAFEVPTQEPPGLLSGETGQDYIDRNPQRYLVQDLGDIYFDRETRRFQRKRPRTLVSEMVQMAADGGEVEYPRRFGGIMPEEGVPDEDSVPALLMPGEFVMTVPAVKGMGDGDLTTGISRMYDVMSRLEKRGRQVA